MTSPTPRKRQKTANGDTNARYPSKEAMLDEDSPQGRPKLTMLESVVKEASIDGARNHSAIAPTPGNEPQTDEHRSRPTLDLNADVTHIDPRGDLICSIISPDDPTISERFLVSSSCLQCASEKWATLINNSPQSLELVDGRSTELRLALMLSHFRHEDVPLKLSFKSLVQTAKLCREHDLRKLFQPYIRIWTSQWLRKLCNPGFEEWIVIAYDLGFREIFEVLCHHLANTIAFNDAGMLCFNQPEGRENANTAGLLDFPEDIQRNLSRIRKVYLERMIQTCYDMINTLSIPDVPVALGSFIHGLRGCGLWPTRPKATDIRLSVNELSKMLSQIHIRSFHGQAFSDCTHPDKWFISTLHLSGSDTLMLVPGTECNNHFEKLPEYVHMSAPSPWECRLGMGTSPDLPWGVSLPYKQSIAWGSGPDHGANMGDVLNDPDLESGTETEEDSDDFTEESV
ncbi:hypothetical protein CC80DRAFT_502295 [Byssothecium circinans]|uniref:Uncharacterized protein n=1 Tax=Byssothecium circinans TaxID=147558 RepID=A0A6A5U276_9PLEO|nr:hypothetical protein CC80DRAFT_502295 [Byssothecium circinans]